MDLMKEKMFVVLVNARWLKKERMIWGLGRNLNPLYQVLGKSHLS